MFKKLTDLAYKRTAIEAFGFYLAYLLFIVLVAAIMGGVSGLLGFSSFYSGIKMGAVLGIIFALLLSFLILKAKNILGNFSYILLALLAGVLAVFGGAILGLIPTAYLTTK